MFGALQGMYQSFQLVVRVDSNKSTEPPIVFRTVITVEAPVGKKFVQVASTSFVQQAHQLAIEPSTIIGEPQAVCRARSMNYQFFVPTDRVLLHTFIDRLCNLGKKCLLSADNLK